MKKIIWTTLAVILLVLGILLYQAPEGHTHVFGEEIPVGRTDAGYGFLKVCGECGEGEMVYYDALLTFVDDDAKMQAMVHWEKIIDETGITMTAAIIPSRIEETTDYDCWWAYAGWDLLSRVREKGVDFVNHTYNHTNLTKLTEEEIRRDLQMSRDFFREHGLDSDILVYPNNAYNDLVVSVVDDYFDAAFACKNKIVTDTDSRSLFLTRMDINDKDVNKVIKFDAERIVECYSVKPVEALQADMDQAVEQNGWLVYMVHAYDSPGGQYYFDEESEQTIIDFCRQVQAMENVKIVNLTEGLAASAPIRD